VETFSIGNVLGVAARTAPRAAARQAAAIAVVAGVAVTLSIVAPAWSWLVLVLDVPLAAIVTAAVVGVLDDESPGVLATIAAGLRRTPSALAVTLLIYLVTFAIAFGMILPIGGAASVDPTAAMPVMLLIGFVFCLVLLYAHWFVALGAAVTERAGPLAALRRSGELTRGRRLQLGAIVVFVGGLWLLVTLVADWLIGGGEPIRGRGALRTGVSMGLWVGFAVLRAAISATAYCMIRRDVEAASPEELRRIFD
jgi:hypothetical protein